MVVTRGRVASVAAEAAELRSENADLRAEVARLQAENATLAGRIAELERLLGLTSRNSSKPPSTDGPAAGRRGRGKGKRLWGGRDGHEGKGRTLLSAEDVTALVDHRPERCRR